MNKRERLQAAKAKMLEAIGAFCDQLIDEEQAPVQGVVLPQWPENALEAIEESGDEGEPIPTLDEVFKRMVAGLKGSSPGSWKGDKPPVVSVQAAQAIAQEHGDPLPAPPPKEEARVILDGLKESAARFMLSDENSVMADGARAALVRKPIFSGNPIEPPVDKADESATEMMKRLLVAWGPGKNGGGLRCTPQRVAKLRVRLKEGFTEEQIVAAIKNIKASPFHRGDNDRGWAVPGPEFILRSAEKLEEWINRDEKISAKPMTQAEKTMEVIRAMKEKASTVGK